MASSGASILADPFIYAPAPERPLPMGRTQFYLRRNLGADDSITSVHALRVKTAASYEGLFYRFDLQQMDLLPLFEAPLARRLAISERVTPLLAESEVMITRWLGALAARMPAAERQAVSAHATFTVDLGEATNTPRWLSWIDFRDQDGASICFYEANPKPPTVLSLPAGSLLAPILDAVSAADKFAQEPWVSILRELDAEFGPPLNEFLRRADQELAEIGLAVRLGEI